MEQKRLYKILALVLLLLMVANAAFFYTEISGPQLQGTGASLLRQSMLAFMVINLVIGAFLTVLLFRALAQAKVVVKEVEVEKQQVVQANAEVDQQQEETERIRQEEEARAAEEKRLDKKLQDLLDDLENERAISNYGEKLLQNIADQEHIVQGLFYLKHHDTQEFQVKSTYAFYSEGEADSFSPGEGLHGQVAQNREILKIDEVPENYVKVYSGLGKGLPRQILMVPIVKDAETIAMLELASFQGFDKSYQQLYNNLSEQVAGQLDTLLNYINV